MIDEIRRNSQGWLDKPSLRVLSHYYDKYVLATSIERLPKKPLEVT